MKKIVLIGPCYPYRGGIALTMSYFYTALSAEYEVVFVNYSLLYPSLLFPGTTQYDESEEHFVKVPSVRLVNSINPLSWLRTARFIARENPDLIAVDWWQPFFGVALYAITKLLRRRFAGKIWFITENVISHEARTTDRLLTKLGLRNADAFLALSQKVVDDLAPFRRAQPVYRSELPIYDWYKKAEHADTELLRAKLGFAASDKVLLFFGYVRKYKGLDILIEAFALLAPKYPEYRLLIAGEFYDNVEDYTSIVEKHGLSERVQFVNQYIPNEAVTQYFALCDLVVQPYRSATQSGIMNVAYGCLKPVLVTDVGGLREFVEDGRTGIVVSTPTPDDVAAGIVRFFALQADTDFSENIRRKVANNGFADICAVFRKGIDGEI